MATELERVETELAAVRAAMTAIAEGGQSVRIGDISYTEASYGALATRERQLAAQVARLSGTRPRMLPVNFGSMYR